MLHSPVRLGASRASSLVVLEADNTAKDLPTSPSSSPPSDLTFHDSSRSPTPSLAEVIHPDNEAGTGSRSLPDFPHPPAPGRSRRRTALTGSKEGDVEQDPISAGSSAKHINDSRQLPQNIGQHPVVVIPPRQLTTDDGEYVNRVQPGQQTLQQAPEPSKPSAPCTQTTAEESRQQTCPVVQESLKSTDIADGDLMQRWAKICEAINNAVSVFINRVTGSSAVLRPGNIESNEFRRVMAKLCLQDDLACGVDAYILLPALIGYMMYREVLIRGLDVYHQVKDGSLCKTVKQSGK